MNTRARLALQLAMECAPNGTVQEAFKQMARDAFVDQADPTLYILNGIVDGLRYGNWPGWRWPVDAPMVPPEG